MMWTINFEVDGTSGSTECPTEQVVSAIADLERAGYKCIDVAPAHLARYSLWIGQAEQPLRQPGTTLLAALARYRDACKVVRDPQSRTFGDPVSLTATARFGDTSIPGQRLAHQPGADHIEVIDTFGGEANYCRVRHGRTYATTPRARAAAVREVAGWPAKSVRLNRTDMGDAIEFRPRGLHQIAFVTSDY